MNDAPTRVGKHSMHDTVFLAQMGLVVLALLDVVYLHAVITLRGEKKSSFVVKIDRKYRAVTQRWFSWSGGLWITSKELALISFC